MTQTYHPLLKGKDSSVSHRHFKEGPGWLYANSKSFTKSFYLQNKLFMEQHLQIIIFIHRCFISYSWLLSGSSINLWQQSHISQVKNKIPSPIIAACNTTWIQVGVPVFSFFPVWLCIEPHFCVSPSCSHSKVGRH